MSLQARKHEVRGRTCLTESLEQVRQSQIREVLANQAESHSLKVFLSSAVYYPVSLSLQSQASLVFLLISLSLNPFQSVFYPNHSMQSVFERIPRTLE